MEERAFIVVNLVDTHDCVAKGKTKFGRDMVKFFDLPAVDLPFPKVIIIEGGLVAD